MQIEFKGVTHTYQEGSPFQSTAIRDVNFTVSSGEFLALIGHTGSGKSTLAQHINGLLRPTGGQVLIDGEDIHSSGYSKKTLRQKVGLVFQYPEHQLFEETVEKDIGFGPRNLGLSEDEILERVQEALRKVGLAYDEFREKSPFELSGGQMRRVAMAGVLAMRPEVLVLDEPAAGLDPMSREDMLQLIRSLHESGTTIIMISHSMDDVARFATRVLVMKKGTVAMDGTPADIFLHADQLEEMGLDVPVICRMNNDLRRLGLPLPEGIYEEDALFSALMQLWKGGENHAS